MDMKQLEAVRITVKCKAAHAIVAGYSNIHLTHAETATLLAASEELDRLRAENAKLLEALEGAVKSCSCRGTGTWETPCTLCGDSTFDHYCNDKAVDCELDWCVKARAALAQPAAKEKPPAGNGRGQK